MHCTLIVGAAWRNNDGAVLTAVTSIHRSEVQDWADGIFQFGDRALNRSDRGEL